MVQRVCRTLPSLILFALLVPAGQPQHQSRDYISAETNRVRIQVIIFDDKGAMANDLSKNDFRVTDDGVVQGIDYFSHVREPVSLVLSLDDSQSMKNKIPFVREAAYSLLAPFPDAEVQKKFDDEFSLIRFAARAEVVAPFTQGDNLRPRIDDLIQPTRSSTALFDSVYLAVAEEQDALNRRRAIILVTDGGDNHSRYSLGETKRFLEEADVPLFAVMAGSSLNFPNFLSPDENPKSKLHLPPIGEPGGSKSGSNVPLLPLFSKKGGDFIGPAELRGPRNLKALTENTGGAVFTARRLDDLDRIVHTIGNAIRYSYLLGYEPPSQKGKGANGWHQVSVQLVPPEKYRGYLIYAKRRYYDRTAAGQRP